MSSLGSTDLDDDRQWALLLPTQAETLLLPAAATSPPFVTASSASPFFTTFYGSDGLGSPISPRREGEGYLYPPRFYKRPEVVGATRVAVGGERARGGRTRKVLSKPPPSMKKSEMKEMKEERVKEKESKSAKGPPEFPPVPFSALFRFTTKFEMALNILGIVCAIAAGASQPLMTLLFGNLTNAFVKFGKAVQALATTGPTPEALAALDVAANDFRKTAAHDALYLVYIGVGTFVGTYIYMVTWIRTSEIATKRIREHYLRSILRQDVAYFDHVGAGEVATRIQTDTHLVQLGISEKVPVAVSFISSFVAGFAVAFIRSWKLALALTSILPCISVTAALVNIYLSRYKMGQLDHIAEGGSLAEEVISTIRTVQAFGAQTTLASLYDTHVHKAHVLEHKAALFQGIGVAVFFFVVYAAYGLSFHFGTSLLINGEVDAGTVVSVILSVLIGSFSLATLAPELAAITNAKAAASKLFTTMDRVPDIDSASPSGVKSFRQHIRGEIHFEGVSFSYPSRPDVRVLKGVNLDFKAGKTTALVGASGSGKSTAVALIERFYDPTSGSVTLDGVSLKDINLKWLRSNIGLVSQEPTLFATTIRANVEHGLIGTGMEYLSDTERMAKVREACIKSNADTFITSLPKGYDTLVGERGFLLSGGQKQRIAIARAIVSDPKILLLDEATSALDTRSEGVVQNALERASRGRTTIVIAHRLSTIKDADCIYVMGDGKVLEQGTHVQLLQNPGGAYARLVQAQKLKESRVDEDAGQEVDGLGLFSPTNWTSPSTSAFSGTTLTFSSQLELIPKAMYSSGGKGRWEFDDFLERPAAMKRMSWSARSAKSPYKKQRHPVRVEKEPGMIYVLKRMAQINKNSWKLYVVGFISATATGMIYPAFGIVYGHAVEAFQYTGHELRTRGDRAALWFFLIAMTSTFAIDLQYDMFMRTAGDLSRRLRELCFRSILRQDIAFFDEEKHSTGSLTTALSQNPEKVAGLAGITMGVLYQSLVTIIGGSIVGLCYGWKLSLVAIAGIPFVISTGYVRLRVVVMKDQINKKAYEESAQLACEAAGAMRTVASLTREDDCLQIYSKSLQAPLKASNKYSIISTFWFALSQSTIFFVIALVFWYGSRLVARQEYDTLEFFVVLISVTFGAVSAGNAFTFVPDISESHIAGLELIRMIDSHQEINRDAPYTPSLAGIKGSIEFRNVRFRYPTRPSIPVLDHFNLRVEPGTHVALVGSSGCGKSTIIQLVERFYDPVGGAVLVDGKDISQVNLADYRQSLALVSQEPTLYAGTIRFNILLGATKTVDKVTQEEIESACRDANILDFIRSLPDGFETEVGGKGTQLSGGQKQRIAIARALLRKPSILLLDEATSALDSQSERVVQEALDRAAKGRTTISIAHRLSSIQKCDRIHFVSDGRIVESGTHEELLQLKGKYAEYVLLQNISYNTHQ